MQIGASTRGLPYPGHSECGPGPLAWGLLLWVIPCMFTELVLLRARHGSSHQGTVESKSQCSQEDFILVTRWGGDPRRTGKR